MNRPPVLLVGCDFGNRLSEAVIALQQDANVPGSFKILSSHHLPSGVSILMNPDPGDLKFDLPPISVYEPPTIDIAKSMIYSGHRISPRLALDYTRLTLGSEGVNISEVRLDEYFRCRDKVAQAIRNCKRAIRRGDTRRKFYWWRVWNRWEARATKLLKK